MRCQCMSMYASPQHSSRVVGGKHNHLTQCSRIVHRHLARLVQQQHGSGGGSRWHQRVNVSPRDAEFATQQLQSILADVRANPAFSPLLDDKKLAAAMKEIAANPAALQKHASNPKVMKVLQCLLGQGLDGKEATAFAEAGTTPTAMFTAIATDAELSKLLSNPTVRTALAQIRANPAAGMAKWGSDPLVSRALDLLEAALCTSQGQAGGSEALIDVAAEEVVLQQQQQQQAAKQLAAAPGSVRIRRRGRIFG